MSLFSLTYHTQEDELKTEVITPSFGAWLCAYEKAKFHLGSDCYSHEQVGYFRIEQHGASIRITIFSNVQREAPPILDQWEMKFQAWCREFWPKAYKPSFICLSEYQPDAG